MIPRGVVWWIESGGHLAELAADGRAWCTCGKRWRRWTLPPGMERAVLEDHIQTAPVVRPPGSRPAP